MQSKFYNKQKSLKRRFLLILGLVVFVSVSGLGVLIIFNQLNLALSLTERLMFGGLFIAYGIIRFIRIFRKDPDEVL